MKSAFLKFSAVAIAASLGMALASCGDDSPNDEPNNPVTPVTPTTDNAMTPTEQKEYLETTAQELMDAMPSSDFDRLSDLGTYMRNTYGEGYDWESVGDWARDMWNSLREAVGTTTTEVDEWGYTYAFTNYKSLIMASNFTGHFTARNGGWVRTDASDLQFIFNDQSGKQCVLRLTTSGNVKRVHAFDLDEYVDYSGRTEYYDRTRCTVGVPANMVVTLSQDGQQVVKASVDVDLSSLSGEEFDLSKGIFSATTTTELNNGYRINVAQAAYSAGNKVSASCTVAKSGRTLVTAAVSSDLSGIPECNVSAFSAENFDIDDYNTDNSNAQSPYVKLDILGKVQIQGRMQNVRDYVDYLNQADENSNSSSMFKSYINQANALTDVNVFYNGKSTKQATVLLEPFEDYSWNGQLYWTAEPVIQFYDGSSYSTFSAFFNESNFKRTVDTFKRLANRYAALVDEHINW